MRVSLPSGECFDVRRDENLLAAAQRAHWLIRFGCRNGNCEACTATLIAGRIEQRGAIVAADHAAQPFLMCLAHAQTDLQIQLPADPLHGSAEHARRVYAQVERIECAADRRWRLLLTLPAGRQLPVYAGQYVQIDSEPARNGFIENIAASGRHISVFVDTAPALTAGARVFVNYPLGYAYRVVDSTRPLWLLCEAATALRALHLHGLWPGSVLIDRDRTGEWPSAAVAPIIHAYAMAAATVQDWYRSLLAARIAFIELRSDFSVLRPWCVCRQDDHGNRFVMADYLDEPAARALAGDFAARGDKQAYWAEPAGNAFEHLENI